MAELLRRSEEKLREGGINPADLVTARKEGRDI
jgi:hypothetical protein